MRRSASAAPPRARQSRGHRNQLGLRVLSESFDEVKRQMLELGQSRTATVVDLPQRVVPSSAETLRRFE
jgi:hypothetical protein